MISIVDDDESVRESIVSASNQKLKSASTTKGAPVVSVVVDDISVRESLELLIQCDGWRPETFASAPEW